MKERGTGRGAQGRTRGDTFRQYEGRDKSFTFHTLSKWKERELQKWPSADTAGKECPVFGWRGKPQKRSLWRENRVNSADGSLRGERKQGREQTEGARCRLPEDHLLTALSVSRLCCIWTWKRRNLEIIFAFKKSKCWFSGEMFRFNRSGQRERGTHRNKDVSRGN